MVNNNVWYLPLLVVLASCATSSPAPSEYQRGTYVPARPAPARPGVGAPVVGQPGQSPTAYPRSPHKRILPPQNGPGIWAGDEPKASNDEGEVPASFLWKQFFFPDDTDFGQARRVKDECMKPYNEAGGVIDAMYNNAFKNIPAKYTEREWTCFLATAYQRCVAELHKSNEAARATAYLNRTEPPFTMKDVSAAANILKRDRCDGVILPKDLSRMLDEVIRLMDGMRHGNQGPRN